MKEDWEWKESGQKGVEERATGERVGEGDN